MKISTGQYARFADGCSVAMMGDTAVMVTVVSKPKATPSSFLPLVVDFRQKSAAAGRIPTNFLRRELGPTEKEILTSRLIDRSLRPLFPAGFNYETQLMCNLLAVDSVYDPDILSINAASASLALSDVPWNGPIAAVKVGLVNSEIIVNPTRKELAESKLNLIVTSMKQNLLVMLEGHADDVYQQDILKAIKAGVKEGHEIINEILRLQKHYGKRKRNVESTENDEKSLEVEDAVRTLCQMRLREIFRDYKHDKLSRDNAVNDVRLNTMDKMKKQFTDQYDSNITLETFNKICKEIFRNLIFEDDIR